MYGCEFVRRFFSVECPFDCASHRTPALPVGGRQNRPLRIALSATEAVALRSSRTNKRVLSVHVGRKSLRRTLRWAGNVVRYGGCTDDHPTDVVENWDALQQLAHAREFNFKRFSGFESTSPQARHGNNDHSSLRPPAACVPAPRLGSRTRHGRKASLKRHGFNHPFFGASPTNAGMHQ